MKFPVFDLHCDTALALSKNIGEENVGLRSNSFHIDLERASVLPGYCQCFACFTTPEMQQWYHRSPESVFEREMETIRWELEKNADLINQVYSVDEIQSNFRKGIMSAIMTIEGPAGFGYDHGLLEELRLAGFMITTLGWNESGPLTGSHLTGEGLTEHGRQYIREAQRVGMAVDVSHISDAGFWDIMDITEAPVIATHSNSRSVCNVSRNLTDEMFMEICKTGGVAGFNFCADFIHDHADLEACCRHFLHFIEMDPTCKHIALGGDLDGCDQLPEGVAGIQDYPALAQALLAHGLRDENLFDIFWNNALGVIDKCCM